MRFRHMHMPNWHKAGSTAHHWAHDWHFWLPIIVFGLLALFTILAIWLGAGTDTNNVWPVWFPYGY